MKTACLLSGGVDSSVALAQMVAQGRRDITAFYLKIWLEDELAYLGDCPWEEDLKYAEAVCKQFGVPLEVVPLQAEYLERVVSYTLAELKKGHTPSPDIFCNQRIKFGAFLEKVGSGYDQIVSGHYATIRQDADGYPALWRGVDPVKDQSYFLSHLSREQLNLCHFPVGILQKREVREFANMYRLATASRPDSQGICFLGKISFRDFVKFHLGTKPGKIVNRDSGDILGEHAGFWFHTIGQRKGLQLSGGPWFVVGKNPEENIVYVSHAQQQQEYMQKQFYMADLNWQCSRPDLALQQVTTCKVRHGERLNSCKIESTAVPGRFLVSLDRADAGIAPGQFCVMYSGERCLGGGMICLPN